MIPSAPCIVRLRCETVRVQNAVQESADSHTLLHFLLLMAEQQRTALTYEKNTSKPLRANIIVQIAWAHRAGWPKSQSQLSGRVLFSCLCPTLCSTLAIAYGWVNGHSSCFCVGRIVALSFARHKIIIHNNVHCTRRQHHQEPSDWYTTPCVRLIVCLCARVREWCDVRSLFRNRYPKKLLDCATYAKSCKSYRMCATIITMTQGNRSTNARTCYFQLDEIRNNLFTYQIFISAFHTSIAIRCTNSDLTASQFTLTHSGSLQWITIRLTVRIFSQRNETPMTGFLLVGHCATATSTTAERSCISARSYFVLRTSHYLVGTSRAGRTTRQD